jgi:hypothetical protein
MPISNETDSNSDWPEAIATVLECRYDMRVGRAMLGVPSGKHFRIRYNYFADGEHHEAELYSATAIPQNTLFPVRYNPDLPHEHSHGNTTSVTTNPRSTLFVIGIVGSVVLSAVWFLLLRGCH